MHELLDKAVLKLQPGLLIGSDTKLWFLYELIFDDSALTKYYNDVVSFFRNIYDLDVKLRTKRLFTLKLMK